jgi:SAM-dependent methyltransferase
VKCRFCATQLQDIFLDLGSAPPSNAFLTAAELNGPEMYFPLRLFTCPACYLVQVDEVQKHEAIFSNSYVYFSSYSRTWLAHAENYVQMVVQRLGLGPSSMVLEIASNDGYLLQFIKARGIPCLGIEPTASTAAVARERGIESPECFFGRDVAREFAVSRGGADLVICNNVLAHVPDINDFVAGLAIVLAQNGVVTVEFPHLLQLVAQRQFDTVYHEHFSYFSLHTVQQIFFAHGLRVCDVDELSTHGGSLRVWACHNDSAHPQTGAVAALLLKEANAGMGQMDYYRGLQPLAETAKNAFLRFLLECKQLGKQVIGYGAAAKGNTLLNYAGVKPDLLPYVVDASPHKQGRYLPGSHIEVVDESRLRSDRPDFVLVLPWNLQEEIIEQLAYIREWGGRFVTAVPHLDIN